MIVSGSNDDREAQKWNRWSAKEMYHVLVEMIGIFYAQHTWIDAGKIAYCSNFVVAESDKGLNISSAPLLKQILWKTICRLTSY